MKIFLVISSLIAITHCQFPNEPVKANMFDATNGFIDSMNRNLFSLNGLIQSHFDLAVSNIWSYWRQAVLYGNSRGFATASDNRTELSDCIGSINDILAKVVSHLTNDVMKPLFDVREADTKIEDDLSKDFDEIKDLIIRATNITCLKGIVLTEYTIGLQYYKYSTFLTRSFGDITYKTQADYNARFYLEQLTAVGIIYKIRSSLMLAKTRKDFSSFVDTYCKPQAFEKFENLIEIGNRVVNDCSKKVYSALNEALGEIPKPTPFKNDIAKCL